MAQASITQRFPTPIETLRCEQPERGIVERKPFFSDVQRVDGHSHSTNRVIGHHAEETDTNTRSCHLPLAAWNHVWGRRHQAGAESPTGFNSYTQIIAQNLFLTTHKDV